MSAPIKVALVGEGANELGGWANEHPYQNPTLPGAMETLLRKVRAEGWQVTSARRWAAKGRNLKVGGRAEHGDTRRLRIAALDASEAGCDALVFIRDEDRDAQRAAAIDAGLAAVRGAWPALRFAGGLAIPALEGWILALTGVHRTETMGVTAMQNALNHAKLAPKDTAAMVAVITSADLTAIPADAHSLKAWLQSAESALAPG